MARTSDPQEPRPRHLRLVPKHPMPPSAPLPPVVPLLPPNQPATPAQDALLTGIARRARLGDRAARDLLWRAFAPRLQPIVFRCGRMAWQREWVRRDGRPWDLEDLRQAGWLVFAELIMAWDGEGSFISYVTAYFPWRLRDAMRRLGPTRRTRPLSYAARRIAECRELHDAESEALLQSIMAALSPADAIVLQMRVIEDLNLQEIARQLGVNRRTLTRRWARICRVARGILRDSAATAPASPQSASRRQRRQAAGQSARSAAPGADRPLE
jgi:RNA polymerase sigma factor (sigma-70 family)